MATLYLHLPTHFSTLVSHSVDGPLLLRLTDDQLKKDLGILPLGHRSALLQAVTKLKEVAPPLEGGAVTGKVGVGGTDLCVLWPTWVGVGDTPPHSSALGPLPPLQAVHRKGDEPRQPASASAHIIPPDAHLGPAQASKSIQFPMGGMCCCLD